jgi:hypothetical protein
MKCKKCEMDSEEKEIDEHHLHPRFMNNTKGDDIKIGLCKKCHNLLHLKIASWIWEHSKITKTIGILFNEERCIRSIKERTMRWLDEDRQIQGKGTNK